MAWDGVRCVLQGPSTDDGMRTYEERITIWQADSINEATELVILEAEAYAKDVDFKYVGLAQAYAIVDELLEPGSEVFELPWV
jgi:hypothetical protein